MCVCVCVCVCASPADDGSSSREQQQGGARPRDSEVGVKTFASAKLQKKFMGPRNSELNLQNATRL